MKAKLLLVPLLLWAGAPVEAQSEPTAKFCRALAALGREAVRTGKPLNIVVFADQPMAFACSHKTKAALEVTFCRAAVDAVGIEFKHRFPWQVDGCLRAQGVAPKLSQVDEYTGLIGRQKIIRLEADLGRRAQIEITFVPTDTETTGEFRNYYGRYEMTVRPR